MFIIERLFQLKIEIINLNNNAYNVHYWKNQESKIYSSVLK